MSGIEARGFLKGFPKGNGRVWKMLFLWMREGLGRKNITVASNCGHPQDSEEWRKRKLLLGCKFSKLIDEKKNSHQHHRINKS